MILDETKNMVIVPPEFSAAAFHPWPYPPDNTRIYEEWYYDTMRPEDARERIYLPIFWTGYYCRHNYGKDFRALDALQQYINSLDNSMKYYTIVQYDDGILNSVKDLNIKVFSMSGKPMDYPLPLICRPHQYTFNVDRDIHISFIGKITHPIRAQIVNAMKGVPDTYISTEPHSMEKYCEILARSFYVLCPRGYGPASFRMAEAFQYGALPICISDQLIFGHKYYYPGIAIPYTPGDPMPIDWREHIKWAVAAAIPFVPHFMKQLETTYEKYYTFEGSKKLMLQDLFFESINLNKLCDPSL